MSLLFELPALGEGDPTTVEGKSHGLIPFADPPAPTGDC
jgi:hypothetical protein